ncbi:MAG: ATP-dependent DNA helicase, partial [Dokdonella sp.]
DVDLVCQLGSPHAIAAFLQRVGRSGHAMGAIPKGRLFPQSRDDLIECTALLDCVRRGELDALKIPRAPLDVLAQQIVAEVASREWDETELFTLLRRAAPYAELSQADYSAVIGMLAEGFSTRLGNRAAYLHRDAVHGRLRGRRSARLTALTAGGTIADNADYAVVLEPQSLTVGSVHEDFAVESLAGDVFQLGNTSYRILRVERDRIRVEDAHGAPPSMPFWLGEAPGRSDELSFAVSRLRGDISAQLQHGNDVAQRWLIAELGLGDSAASQIIDYLERAKAALGVLPTLTELAMERFFDESGGTQLIIHSPYGSRINKAWGLALRKRFCRSFNFELQAAATEDAIVLSLSTSHSFPLEEVARYLHSATASDVLVQALLDAPLFGVRWRWAATTALALPRYSGGKKVAPQLQRMKSEDLLACVFPDQVACQENIVGERQIPVHPLVAQTLHDCLTEAMDLPGWLELLRGLESGRVRMVARDLPQPSPLAAEILCAQPYAFLDDAPLEERRSHAVSMRRWSDPQSADALGQLDSDAIAAVRAEAAPQARDADEMHEVLLSLTVLPEVDVDAHADWAQWLQQLANSGRATRMAMGASGAGLWCAAERLGLVRHVFADAPMQPPITIPAGFEALGSSREAAIVELLRGRLAILGPAEVTQLAISLMLPAAEIEIALLALEREGYVMRGRFTPHTATDEWCERHLLARIHRYTVQRLRREIEPVEPRDFMRFLFDWQHVGPSAALSGPDAVAAVITQLEGFEAAAGAWESDILSARVSDYSPSWLDDLCRSGRVVWSRLRPSSRDASGGGPVRATPIVLLPRRSLPLWSACTQAISIDSASLSSRAAAVLQQLSSHGASFFDELATAARLLDSELEDALGELVARGMINADSFAGLRALLTPASRRRTRPMRRHRHALLLGIADAGRWSLLRAPPAEAAAPAAANQALDAEALEHIARSLLRRYGVVCWRLLAREAAWLPPWRELARVYQRLEARGELRGGRFVAGVSGEQFALPEAIPLLRRARGQERSGHLVALSGADPLNLVGIVGAGTRLPALASTRLVYRDGVLAAHVVAGKVTVDESLQAADAQLVRQALLIERARRVALT